MKYITTARAAAMAAFDYSDGGKHGKYGAPVFNAPLMARNSYTSISRIFQRLDNNLMLSKHIGGEDKEILQESGKLLLNDLKSR